MLPSARTWVPSPTVKSPSRSVCICQPSRRSHRQRISPFGCSGIAIALPSLPLEKNGKPTSCTGESAPPHRAPCSTAQILQQSALLQLSLDRWFTSALHLSHAYSTHQYGERFLREPG